MDISLAPHYQQLLRKCVKSGRYNDISEIMDEALRLWEQQKSAATWLKQEAMTGYEDMLAGRITEISSEDEFLALARGESQ